MKYWKEHQTETFTLLGSNLINQGLLVHNGTKGVVVLNDAEFEELERCARASDRHFDHTGKRFEPHMICGMYLEDVREYLV